MSIDAHYTNPKLTKLYDLDSGWSKDRDFYLNLATPGNKVLDLGCGTGLLSEAFAKRSCDVTAVDPAEGMLQIAKRKRSHSNDGSFCFGLLYIESGKELLSCIPIFRI